MNFARIFTRKRIAAVAAMGALGLTATSAWAGAIYPSFTVDPSQYYSGASTFTADKITGGYAETFTVNSSGSFGASVKWNAGQFFTDNGSTGLTGAMTGLGNTYGLFGLFQGSGTATVSGGAANYSLTSGRLDLYIDPSVGAGNPTGDSFTAPTTGYGNYVSSGGSNDVLVATGNLVNGSGSQKLPCTTGIDCGSFGQTLNFALTDPAGKRFFTSPTNFYSLAFQSGQFNTAPLPPSPGQAAITNVTDGSLDNVFVAVPEPGALLILGTGLLGMGMLIRKRGKRRLDS